MTKLPAVQGPEGTNILTGKTRVFDSDRDAIRDYLARAFAAGAIDQAEHEARMSAALNAKHKGELELLTSDIPTIMDDEYYRQVREAIHGKPKKAFKLSGGSKISTELWLFMCFTCLVAGVCFGLAFASL